MTKLGENIIRIDAQSKVTGQALYPGDFNFENQLYMKVLFAGVPHAIVKSIDIENAKNLPGVICILTAKDVPNNGYGLSGPDQPVLCGPGSTNPYGDRVRFMGDQVALVIAESDEIANKAKKLIKVEYQELEAFFNIEEARKDQGILIHPDKGSNTFCHYKIRKGDTLDALAQSDIVIESTYHTPVQEHAFLQPEAGISYIDEAGRITVVVGGQWTNEDQEQIAHALNLPLDRIRVIYPAIGGAFGGREDMSVQIILALAVLRLQEKGICRPVKIIWSREESIIGHHKRHPYTFHTRWGATKDGIITAAEVEILADGGAYIYTSTKVLGNATLLSTGPYRIPNVKVDAYAVYTNNIPNGAFRGFGGPQGAFCAEMQINKIADKLGIDPVEIRLRNLVNEGEEISVQSPLPPGLSIKEVVKECAKKSGWIVDAKTGEFRKPDHILGGNNAVAKKGIGFACGFKNIGFSYGAKETCWARIELQGKAEIEKAILYHAGAEVGQGSHSAFLQMASHALNVPMNRITLIASDTANTENSGSVSASRMTFMAGNAIKGAAEDVLLKWNAEERPAISEFTYHAPATSKFDAETGKCEPNFAYGYVAEAIECLVDTETGKIEISSVICADDVGKAINHQQVEGQIEGAIIQSAGYVLNENFIQKNGKVLTDKFSTYLIPTSMDIPNKVDSIIMEIPDPRGPWGARGVGEMPFLPFAPAVMDAVHQATGVWFDDFPLTPEKVYTRINPIKDE